MLQYIYSLMYNPRVTFVRHPAVLRRHCVIGDVVLSKKIRSFCHETVPNLSEVMGRVTAKEFYLGGVRSFKEFYMGKAPGKCDRPTLQMG